MCAKDSHFEWDTEAMDEENTLGDASQANDEIQDTISIISDISEEDVPTSGQNTPNNFSFLFYFIILCAIIVYWGSSPSQTLHTTP